MQHSVARDEHRKFHRILYRAPCTLEADSGRYNCRVVDISIKGCLLILTETEILQYGKLYAMVLTLSEDVVIKMQLRLVHLENYKAGFECQYIDIESISQLRRLLELNLGDSELLERELSTLSHFADEEH